jgi:hypothetical protein
LDRNRAGRYTLLGPLCRNNTTRPVVICHYFGQKGHGCYKKRVTETAQLFSLSKKFNEPIPAAGFSKKRRRLSDNFPNFFSPVLNPSYILNIYRPVSP